MADYKLSATSPLNAASVAIDGVSLKEETDLSLVSISTPTGGEEAFEAQFKSAFGAPSPQTGASVQSDDGFWVLGLQRDQRMAVFQNQNPQPVDVIKAKLGEAGYYTDQSDSWVIVSISGDRVERFLEHVSTLDVSQDAFPVGQASRTLMLHLGAILARKDETDFLVLAPRSFADSLWESLLAILDNFQAISDGEANAR